MTFLHSCPVDDTDAYTDDESWVHGSVKSVSYPWTCGPRVLASMARRGATVVVASICAVLVPGSVYISQAQGSSGISSTWRHLLHAAWESPTSLTTQVQAFSQQLHDNQPFLDCLKAAFVNSCYANTEEKVHQELGLDTQGLVEWQDGPLVSVTSFLSSAYSMVHYSLDLGVESIHIHLIFLLANHEIIKCRISLTKCQHCSFKHSCLPCSISFN